MLVKINKFTNINSWYNDSVGKTFSVREFNEVSYLLNDDISKLILKDDCTIVVAAIENPTKVNKQLITRIDEIFEAKLQAKTGWGRNDVLDLYRKSVTEALLEIID